MLEDSTPVEPPPAPGKKSTGVLWPAIAVGLLLALGLSTYAWWRATRPVEQPLTRLSVDLGAEALRAPRATLALSPDGNRIAYIGRGPEGLRQLFTRRLDEPTATPFPGTTFGPSLAAPFLSPKGDWIGFFAGDARRGQGE